MRGPRAVHDRINRLLVMLPWLMQRERVSVAEMATVFGVSERQLVRDLEIAAMCGLPPYIDELIDVFVDDGVVHAGVPRVFTRPPRLTAEEGFTLLAAGRVALELPGAEPEGALARALDKLEAALGARVAVRLERPPALDAVQGATERSEAIAVTYYTFSRDDVTERVLHPHAVFSDAGKWYVVADDSQSGEERRFRVDRIESVRPTGERFARRAIERAGDARPAPSIDSRVVTLVVAPEARWVVERTPLLEREALPDGRVRARLAVTNERWLASLLVQGGPAVQVEDPPDLADLGRSTAARLLERYRR